MYCLIHLLPALDSFTYFFYEFFSLPRYSLFPFPFAFGPCVWPAFFLIFFPAFYFDEKSFIFIVASSCHPSNILVGEFVWPHGKFKFHGIQTPLLGTLTALLDYSHRRACHPARPQRTKLAEPSQEQTPTNGVKSTLEHLEKFPSGVCCARDARCGMPDAIAR